MVLLEDIKEMYYEALCVNEHRGFEQYLKEEFTPCYDDQLNFIGYERK